MKKILCWIGIHDDKYCEEPSDDGGVLGWRKCSNCERETEKSCHHSFGPFTVELKD